MKKYLVASSILSANYLYLQKELDQAIKAGIDWLHFDVMDGDFVPNLTFGPKILQDIRTFTDIFIDCHLMVKIKHQTVEDYLLPFINAKASLITLHYEALTPHQLSEFLTIRNKYQIKIGIAIKPQTNIKLLFPLLNRIDVVLIMTVEPGFGGQKFIYQAAEKIKILHDYLYKNNLNTLIEVDGGINNSTAQICKNNGVNVLVAGSYLFGSKNFTERVKELANE